MSEFGSLEVKKARKGSIQIKKKKLTGSTVAGKESVIKLWDAV